jgi:hypothetical protein
MISVANALLSARESEAYIAKFDELEKLTDGAITRAARTGCRGRWCVLTRYHYTDNSHTTYQEDEHIMEKLARQYASLGWWTRWYRSGNTLLLCLSVDPPWFGWLRSRIFRKKFFRPG